MNIISIVGLIIIAGVLVWLFIITLPFLWWIYLIILGWQIVKIGFFVDAEKKIQERKEKK